MKALLLILLIAFGVQGQSIKEGKGLTDWKLITDSPDIKANVFYAPGSVKRNGNQIRLWARWDFPEGAEAQLAPDWHGATVGSFRAFLSLSCQEKTLMGSTIVGYDMGGNVIAEERGKIDVSEKPGTVGSVIFNYFCEREPPPPKTPPKLKP